MSRNQALSDEVMHRVERMHESLRKGHAAPSSGPGHDGEPPEEISVKGSDPETRIRKTVTRNANHCRICWLHRQRYLNDNGDGGAALGDLRHQAAERLQDDYALSGLASIPSTLSALMAPGNGGNGGRNATEDALLSKIGASSRLEGALIAAGYSNRLLLIRVILEDRSLKDVAKIMGVNQTALMPALRGALDSLATYYGLTLRPRAKIRGGEAQPLHPFHDVSHGTQDEN